MEELYRQMYLKYASHLSEDEINEKVSYATTQDSTSFTNLFYQKYTGSGPSKQQSHYISNYTQESQTDTITQPDNIEQPNNFLRKGAGAFVNAIDRNVAGILNMFEQGQGVVNDIYQQIEESGSKDPRDWKELTGEQKVANRQKVRQEGFDLGLFNLRTSKEMEDRIAKFEANQTRYNNTISEEILKGLDADWGQVVERTILGGIGSWTSFLAMLSPKALLVLGGSTMGNKWDEEFDIDPDRANGLLFANAVGTGAIEFGEGMITRRLIGIPFIKAIKNGTASGSAVTAAKDMVMNGSVLALKRLGIAMGGEGSMEMAQALATTLLDKAILGYVGDNLLGYSPGDDRYDTKLGTWKKWYEIFDEGIIGAFMGSNVNIATQGIEGLQGNTAQRRAEVLLRPKSDQDFINKKYKELSELHKESQSPDITPDVLERTRNKINALSDEIIIKQSQSQKIVKTLRGDALIEYATNVDKINKANKAIDKSNKVGEVTQNNISKLNQEDRDKAIKRNEEIWKDHVHKSLNRNLNISEAYAKATGMEQIVIDNEDEYQEIYNNTSLGKDQISRHGYADDIKSSDGFHDGQGKWYINKNQALKMEAVSVGSHELLHGLMRTVLRDSEGKMTKEGKALIHSFRNTLSVKESRIINRKIDTNYKYKRDNKGNLLKDAEGKIIENDFGEYGEEYLNAFSDSIQKNEINYNEGVFSKLINVFQSLFKSKGLNKNFKDGIDLYEFLKTYDKSIQTGKVDKDIAGMLKASVKGRATVVQKSQTGDLMTDINDLVEPGISKNEFVNNGYLDAYSAITETDLLNGLIGKGIGGTSIHGRSKNEFMDEVKTRLGLKMWREFDPTKNNLFGWLSGKKNTIEFVKGDVSNAWKSKTDKPIQSLDTTIEGKEGSQMARQIQDTAMNPEEAMIAKEEVILETQEDNLRKELGIKKGGDLYNEILDANELAFGSELPSIESNTLRKAIEPAFVTKLTDKLVDLMGKGKKYEKFIDKYSQTIIRKIPLRALVEIERLIPENKRIFTKVIKKNLIPSEIRAHEKKYGHSENLYYESETQGPTLYKKLDPTAKQIKEFLLVPIKIISKKTGKEVRSGLRGNRKTKIASLVAIELGFDATMDVLKSKPKRLGELIRNNKLWLQEEIEEFGRQISRNPNVKFSYTLATALRDDVVTNGWDSIFNSKFELRNANLRKTYGDVVEEFLNVAIEKLEELIPAKTRMAIEKLFSAHKKSKGKEGMKRGKGTEFEYLNVVKSHNIPGYDVQMKEGPTEKGGVADIKAAIHGLNANTEIKFNSKAQFGSFNIQKYDVKTGEVTWAKEPDQLYLDMINAQIKRAQPALEKYYRRANELLKIYNAETSKDFPPIINNLSFIPQKVWDQLSKSKGENLAVQILNSSKYETDAGIIKYLYNNKPGKGNKVYLIEILEDGLFGMNNRNIKGPDGKPIRELEAIVELRFRIKSTGKETYLGVEGHRPRMSVIPNIIELQSKSDLTLLNKKHVKAIVKNSKPSKSQTEALNNNNRITLSKSVSLEESIIKLKNMDKALKMARRKNPPKKGASFIDFDDTLARTKSNVYYTKPNETGKPSPKRKAIFMIGGPGSGKTNIGRGLQLGREGFKVVNQDIFVEVEKAKQGLPESEQGYTKEQGSLRAKIGAAGIRAAKTKLKKYTTAGEGMVIDGTGASYNATMKKVKDLEAQGYEVHMVYAKTSVEAAKERNRNRPERRLPTWIVAKTHKSVEKNIEQYKKDFGDRFIEIDTETIEYGKPLPKEFIDKVKSKVYENEVGVLNAEEFAKQGDLILEKGGKLDFSDFSEVKQGKVGPFFNKAKALKDKFGNSDIYVLTARPADAAPAIQRFLKGVGLDLKIENIIGLGNSTSIAKAEVIIEKAAEGYNDFLFADDQIQNVTAVKKVLDILDIKGKTYQARVQFSNTLNENFNYVLEEAQGMDPNESISNAAARVQGAVKNKWTFFIPPSAEDFVGLLYNFIGKGPQGEIHIKFLENALVKPFATAYRMLNATKQAISVDFKGLKNKYKGVWGYMNKDSGYKNFTYGDAVRVFLWDRAGHNIPGMDQVDINALVNIVHEFGDLTSFSNDLELITRLDSYPEPTEYWTSGNIVRDLYHVTQNIHRKQYLQEWIENKNEIFNPDNMNKIEALYGSNFREALEDMLWRMESGTNRKFGKNRQVNNWLNWVNNSVGAIMFINIRSAMLQTISMINFTNWTDNNPLKAAAAFANQPQFWKDFSMIFNSDTLKQRRAGLQTDVNAAELADAVVRGQGKFNAALNYILKKGFTPTQMADSFAISMGGATFYRNRMNTYLNQGMSEKEAHKIAFSEFLEISEKTQQSARPDLISQQQAGPLGRLILAFQNTPMQYMRLTKKAMLDLKNGRGDVKTNISKIVYYTTIQNIIFSGLQSALFMAMGFSDDEEMIEDKKVRALNTSVDSVLRGMGIAGATVSTLKNMFLQFRKQNAKGWSGDHGRTLLEAANISPPIGSKLRKLYNSFISYKYNKDEVHQMGFHPDNPGILGIANFISATTNIPLDRAVMLINSARASTDSRNATWQRIMTALGWNTWDVGIKTILPKVKKSRKKTRKKKKRKS